MPAQPDSFWMTSLPKPVPQLGIQLCARKMPMQSASTRMHMSRVAGRASSQASCSAQISGPKNGLPAPADAFAQAVATWYDEIHNYDFSNPGADNGVACPTALDSCVSTLRCRDQQCYRRAAHNLMTFSRGGGSPIPSIIVSMPSFLVGNAPSYIAARWLASRIALSAVAVTILDPDPCSSTCHFEPLLSCARVRAQVSP